MNPINLSPLCMKWTGTKIIKLEVFSQDNGWHRCDNIYCANTGCWSLSAFRPAVVPEFLHWPRLVMFICCIIWYNTQYMCHKSWLAQMAFGPWKKLDWILSILLFAEIKLFCRGWVFDYLTHLSWHDGVRQRSVHNTGSTKSCAAVTLCKFKSTLLQIKVNSFQGLSRLKLGSHFLRGSQTLLRQQFALQSALALAGTPPCSGLLWSQQWIQCNVQSALVDCPARWSLALLFGFLWRSSTFPYL